MFQQINSASFWPIIGELCLALTIATSFFASVVSAVGERKKNWRLVLTGQRSLYISAAFISMAVFILLYCFLSDNYLVRYVYGYSNRAMPIIYKITALWGGQDGSLLFWVWLTSLFAALSIFLHRNSDKPLLAYAISVLGVVIGFFGILLIYSDNPFELFPQAPPDGRGLNPLLQNPSMAIHPPALYLGYVGMTIPFAFAISALLSNRLDTRWITATRIWTLIAWFFLSIGNILGAQWAYVELGWGGFWGWDPVENAAILPWFTTSAFLHSVMIQEKRGMLKFWNMNLIVISFCLTILGTYLTRSGVVQSVHTFARSPIGYFFLTFLGVVIVFSAFMIWKRREELKSSTIFESFISKESAFVLNNIALVGTAFIVLWCTLFPTASEILIGSRIIVGPPFFNQMLAPIAIVLLILTGVGPLIGWKKATKANLTSSFTWPIIIGLAATGGALLLNIRHWYVLCTIFGSAFVFCCIATEFYRGSRARMISHQEPWWKALIKATFRNNRKYGGYVVHLGLVFIFMGIAGTAYKEIYEFDLKPGETKSFNEYTIQFKDFEMLSSENQDETYAIVDLYMGERFVATVRPARFFYKNPQQPSTEVDIYSRLKEDVYFTIGSINPETGQTKIHVTLNPLVSWLWLGGLILVLGGIVTMLPPLAAGERRKKKA